MNTRATRRHGVSGGIPVKAHPFLLKLFTGNWARVYGNLRIQNIEIEVLWKNFWIPNRAQFIRKYIETNGILLKNQMLGLEFFLRKLISYIFYLKCNVTYLSTKTTTSPGATATSTVVLQCAGKLFYIYHFIDAVNRFLLN